MIAVELGHRVIWIKARRAALARPFVFRFLHVEHDLRELLDIADVVGMGVGGRETLDIGRLHAKLFKLARKRLGPLHVKHAIGPSRAVRHGGDSVGETGVPEKPALGVMDEIAIVG